MKEYDNLENLENSEDLENINEAEINTELKEKMNDIEIPEELSERIRMGVEKAAGEKSKNSKNKNPFKLFLDLPGIQKASFLGSVAAVLVLTVLTYTYLPVFMAVLSGSQEIPAPDRQNDFYDSSDPSKNNASAAENPGEENNRTGIALSSVGKVTITPVDYTDDGVAVDSVFEIKTSEEFSEEELRERLSVKTGETFVLSKVSEGNNSEFVLYFDEPLEANKIYNIEYSETGSRPLSFAFQTEEKFKLLSVFPANDGDNWRYNVAVDTVIELTFNEELSDIADLPDHVQISYMYDETVRITGRWEK